ncbi:MAG: hypothetical protein U0228_22685 [Myxococcaceae bacterium]
MRAHLIVALAVAVLPSLASAEDCALELKSIKPQFAAKLPSGFKLVSTKKEKRQLTQVLKTPDGFEVTLTLGGCSHVAYSFGIKGGTLTTRTVGSELVAVSKRVLPTLPMGTEVIADPGLFLKAIDDSNIMSLPAQLRCGDATCTLSIEAVPEKPAKGKKAPPKKADKKSKDKDKDKDGEEGDEKKDEMGAEKKPVDLPDGPGVLKLSYDFAL